MQMKVIAVNDRKYYNITNSNEKKIPGKVSAAACKQVVNGRLAKYTYKQTNRGEEEMVKNGVGGRRR